MPVRVLHLSETGRGGVGGYLDLIAESCGEGLAHLAVLPETEAISVRHMEAAPFPDRGRGWRRLMALRRAAGRALADWSPDVVFLHSTFALALLPWLRLRRPGLPVIYSAHGWARARYGGGVAQRFVGAFEGGLPGLAQAVVCVSEAERALAAAHGYRGRMVVIENAAPDRPAHPEGPFAEDSLNLLFVGRVARQKGLDILLPAFAEARAKNPALRLVIAGGSASEIGSGHAGVEALGWVPSEWMPGLLAGADAVVLPSRWEGLPMVVPDRKSVV